MLSYQQALGEVLATVQPLSAEKCELSKASGLVLAEPVVARWDMPRWDNSAMDGFAIGADSITDKGLKIVGSAFAGHPYSLSVKPGEAVQITTGAPLPSGCDTVVPVEETENEADRLLLQGGFCKGQHVRYRGEEFTAGEQLLAAGDVLHAGAIGLLASAGIDQVSVVPRPRVAIFSTGDELVELGQEPGPGQIINSNLQFLSARLQECGCEPLVLGIGADSSNALEPLLDKALQADLILSTGGVSIGAKDLVQESLQRRGFVRSFWKVAIKPGKPVLFGTLSGKPCFGLPGNPAATAATFELLVRPALQKMAGFKQFSTPRLRARLGNTIRAAGKRQSFLWGELKVNAGALEVLPLQSQGSGQNRSLQRAHALLPVPIDSPGLQAGTEVEVLILRLPSGPVIA